MKLIDRIDRKPVFAAFGRSGGSAATFSVLRDAENVMLLSGTGEQTVLQAASQAGAGLLMAGMVLQSLGMAPVFTLTNDLIIGTAPPAQAGAASGISETASGKLF